MYKGDKTIEQLFKELEKSNKRIVELEKSEAKHKQTEGKLRSSKHFIEKIANTAPNFIYVIDIINKKYLYANDAYEKMFGLQKEKILADDGYDFILSRVHPDDLKKIIEKENSILEKLNNPPGELEQKKVYEFEYRVKDKDDNWRWLYSWGTFFEINNNGKVCQILGIAQDITERKQVEEALRESETKYKLLFETSLEGIAVSKGNQIITANQSVIDIFGYNSLEEFTRIPLLNHVAPESREMINKRLKKRQKGEPLESQYEYKIVRQDGEIRELEISTVEAVISSEKCVLGTFRDITESKQAENELKQKMSQLERFNRLTVDRELRMIELKKEINELLKEAGRPEKYSAFERERSKRCVGM